MAQERIIMAIGRIERTLARLETAGVRPDIAAQGGSDGDADIARRHAALKAEAVRAVGAIDDLLEGLD